MIEQSPTLSVIMPCYNSEKFIEVSVRSILEQTFDDFELIIIDDASTDSTIQRLEQINDARIRIIKKQKNTGITDSLNLALKIASGKYIARMDSDDISEKERFEKQIQYLEHNTEVVLCGSWYKTFPDGSIARLPEKHDEIKIWLLYSNAICHPSVMFRKQFFIDHFLNYNKNSEPAEDYELWTRVVGIGKIANVPRILLHYRLHNQQVSYERSQIQKRTADQCRIRMLHYLKPTLTEEEVTIITKIFAKEKLLNAFELKIAANLLTELKRINSKTKFYLEPDFLKYITNYQRSVFENYFVFNKRFDRSLLKTYLVNIKAARVLSGRQNLGILIKCLLRWNNEKEGRFQFP